MIFCPRFDTGPPLSSGSLSFVLMIALRASLLSPFLHISQLAQAPFRSAVAVRSLVGRVLVSFFVRVPPFDSPEGPKAQVQLIPHPLILGFIFSPSVLGACPFPPWPLFPLLATPRCSWLSPMHLHSLHFQKSCRFFLSYLHAGMVFFLFPGFVMTNRSFSLVFLSLAIIAPAMHQLLFSFYAVLFSVPSAFTF